MPIPKFTVSTRYIFTLISVFYSIMLLHTLWLTVHSKLVISGFMAAGNLALYLFCYAILQKNKIEKLLILAFSLYMAALLLEGTPENFIFAFNWIGIAPILYWWYRTVVVEHARSPHSLQALTTIMLFHILLVYSQQAINIFSTTALVSNTYDATLYHFDLLLGVNLPAILGQLFQKYPLLDIFCRTAYTTLPAGLLLAFYTQYIRLQFFPVNILHAFLIAGCFILLYTIIPACGPAYLFSGLFPFYDAETAYTGILSPTVPRNAMPSLHALWVLIIWVNIMWYCRWPYQLFFTIFTTLTLIATMGLGEHYFIDLIAAVPLVLTVQGLVAPLPFLQAERWQSIITGCAIFSILLLALCYKIEWFNFYNSWSIIIITVTITAIMLIRLMRAIKL